MISRPVTRSLPRSITLAAVRAKMIAYTFGSARITLRSR